MHSKPLIPLELSFCKMFSWKEKEGFLQVRRMPKAVTEIGFKSNFLEIIKPFCLLLRTDKTWPPRKIIPEMFAWKKNMTSCVSFLINSFGIFNKLDQSDFEALKQILKCLDICVFMTEQNWVWKENIIYSFEITASTSAKWKIWEDLKISPNKMSVKRENVRTIF